MWFSELAVGDTFRDGSGKVFVKEDMKHAVLHPEGGRFNFTPRAYVDVVYLTMTKRIGKYYQLVSLENTNLIVGWRIGHIIRVESVSDDSHYNVTYKGSDKSACIIASEELIRTCCKEVASFKGGVLSEEKEADTVALMQFLAGSVRDEVLNYLKKHKSLELVDIERLESRVLSGRVLGTYRLDAEKIPSFLKDISWDDESLNTKLCLIKALSDEPLFTVWYTMDKESQGFKTNVNFVGEDSKAYTVYMKKESLDKYCTLLANGDKLL